MPEKMNDPYSWWKSTVIIRICFGEFNGPAHIRRVFDVGCGKGEWTRFFLTWDAEVVAVDKDIETLKINWKRNKKAMFVVADATDVLLPHSLSRFDLIFCNDVIEHIKDDRKFLANMRGYCNADGKILVVTQNNWSLNYVLQGLWTVLKGKQWQGWDEEHVRFYNPRELREKLRQAGFRPVKWFSSYFLPYRPIKERFGLDLSKLFTFIEWLGWYDKFPLKYLGWSLGVLAEKWETDY